MPITFTKVKAPHGWLGNFASFSVHHLGADWPTTEALFQALRFADPVIREAIRVQTSPMRAKIIARQNADKMVVQPGSQQDLDNMELCLRLKLQQYPELAEKLLATGEEVLIENVSNRPFGRHLFWGMALRAEGWTGENHLGRLWMKLRDELRQG